jgi:hypothetical protein
MTELLRVKVLQVGCPDCCNSLLQESQSLGGLPLGGAIVEIPRHWFDKTCPHGRSGFKFQLLGPEFETTKGGEEDVNSGEVEFGIRDSKMDATRDIGYPARERGPYGSHPGHDDFDDESGPDGSGTY